MAVVWTDVRDLPGGEFSGFSQTVIESYVTLSESLLSSTFFGTKYDSAVLYLTAHNMIMTASGGAGSVPAGPVTGRTAGPMAEQFADHGRSVYKRHPETSWGNLFDQIVHSLRYKTIGVMVP